MIAPCIRCGLMVRPDPRWCNLEEDPVVCASCAPSMGSVPATMTPLATGAELIDEGMRLPFLRPTIQGDDPDPHEAVAYWLLGQFLGWLRDPDG